MSDFQIIFKDFAKEKSLRPDLMQDQMVEALNTLYAAFTLPIKASFFKRAKPKPVKGLYVWGGVGRGKTMIMDLFYQSVPMDETAKERVHFNIFILDIHLQLQALKDAGKGKDPLPQIAKTIAAETRLLCFDEFQVYDIADAMVLSELFSALFAEGVTVIATSNVAPDDLYKNGLQRARFLPFINMVKKHMDILHLDSETDYRQQALKEEGTYFIRAERPMRRLFDKLIAPNKATAEKVNVKGRKLPVKLAANGCAWIEFAELCEKPRAAVDYQALSNAYQTIFVNKVPRMGYDRRNEAKRFILLIDTLYDARRRVILNAEVEPQKLYKGKDHAFEFERTISRLLEMQGDGWP